MATVLDTIRGGDFAAADLGRNGLETFSRSGVATTLGAGDLQGEEATLLARAARARQLVRESGAVRPAGEVLRAEGFAGRVARLREFQDNPRRYAGGRNAADLAAVERVANVAADEALGYPGGTGRPVSPQELERWRATSGVRAGNLTTNAVASARDFAQVSGQIERETRRGAEGVAAELARNPNMAVDEVLGVAGQQGAGLAASLVGRAALDQFAALEPVRRGQREQAQEQRAAQADVRAQREEERKRIDNTVKLRTVAQYYGMGSADAEAASDGQLEGFIEAAAAKRRDAREQAQDRRAEQASRIDRRTFRAQQEERARRAGQPLGPVDLDGDGKPDAWRPSPDYVQPLERQGDVTEAQSKLSTALTKEVREINPVLGSRGTIESYVATVYDDAGKVVRPDQVDQALESYLDYVNQLHGQVYGMPFFVRQRPGRSAQAMGAARAREERLSEVAGGGARPERRARGAMPPAEE